MWDVASGRELRQFKGHKEHVRNIAFASDNKTLAAVVQRPVTFTKTEPAEVWRWDVATGKKRSFCLLLPGDFSIVKFSPDARTLITRTRNYIKGEKTNLWDVATGKRIGQLSSLPFSVAFSADGKTLAGTSNRTIQFWDPATGKELRRVPCHIPESFLSHITFLPDTRTVVSWGGSENTFHLWDATSGAELDRFEGHNQAIVAVGFSADGKLLASAQNDEVRLWNLGTAKEIRRVPGGPGQLWNLVSGRELLRKISWGGGPRVMAFSPDRTILALGNGNLTMWDTRTWKLVRGWQTPLDRIFCLAFSPDGKLLAGGGYWVVGNQIVGPGGAYKDFPIHIWEVATGRELPPIGKHRRPVTWVTFSPDGRALATVTWDNNIFLWERASGQLRATLTTGDHVATVTFSPNGRFLASTNDGNYPGGHKYTGKEDSDKVRLWDLATGKEAHRFLGHRGIVTSVAFSPDGRLLASGSWDTTTLIWDMTEVYRKARTRPVCLKVKELETLWKELTGSDGARSYKALWSLAAAPEQTVAFLKKHIHPVSAADPQQVARLAADLDSKNFSDRQKAMRTLEQLGVPAKPQLRRIMAGAKSEEQRRRLQILLKRPEPICLSTFRAVELLEYIGKSEAREFLQALARGVPDARLTQEAEAALKSMNRLLP